MDTGVEEDALEKPNTELHICTTYTYLRGLEKATGYVLVCG